MKEIWRVLLASAQIENTENMILSGQKSRAVIQLKMDFGRQHFVNDSYPTNRKV